MKRAVLDARVSTDAQQKEGTIESQVLEIERQIAAAGDVLVKEYSTTATAARFWIGPRSKSCAGT